MIIDDIALSIREVARCLTATSSQMLQHWSVRIFERKDLKENTNHWKVLRFYPYLHAESIDKRIWIKERHQWRYLFFGKHCL